jgi:hypothetical protein
MIVNEREAAIVRWVFETYANTQIGLDKIAQQLEDQGALTKQPAVAPLVPQGNAYQGNLCRRQVLQQAALRPRVRQSDLRHRALD